MRKIIGMTVTAILLGTLAGCCSSTNRKPFFRRSTASPDCGCDKGRTLLPGDRLTPTPIQPGGNQPPVTSDPPPFQRDLLPRGQDNPFPEPPREDPPPISTNPLPRRDVNPFPPRERENLIPSERWRPAPRPEARILPPVEWKPEEGAPSRDLPPRDDIRLSPPKEDDPLDVSPPIRVKPLPPEPVEPDKKAPVLPVDIPYFAEVKKDVHSGQKPFPEGLAWLKEEKFKTILHIIGPDEDDSVARKQFESRGFKYVNLRVSPKTLNRRIVDDFNHIVTDPTNYRIFVYDRDGSLAGGLWYLHFRIIDRFSNEKAGDEAERLGFRENDDNNHRDMWIAVQKFLQNRKPD